MIINEMIRFKIKRMKVRCLHKTTGVMRQEVRDWEFSTPFCLSFSRFEIFQDKWKKGRKGKK